VPPPAWRNPGVAAAAPAATARHGQSPSPHARSPSPAAGGGPGRGWSGTFEEGGGRGDLVGQVEGGGQFPGAGGELVAGAAPGGPDLVEDAGRGGALVEQVGGAAFQQVEGVQAQDGPQRGGAGVQGGGADLQDEAVGAGAGGAGGQGEVGVPGGEGVVAVAAGAADPGGEPVAHAALGVAGQEQPHGRGVQVAVVGRARDGRGRGVAVLVGHG